MDELTTVRQLIQEAASDIAREASANGTLANPTATAFLAHCRRSRASQLIRWAVIRHSCKTTLWWHLTSPTGFHSAISTMRAARLKASVMSDIGIMRERAALHWWHDPEQLHEMLTLLGIKSPPDRPPAASGSSDMDFTDVDISPCLCPPPRHSLQPPHSRAPHHIFHPAVRFTFTSGKARPIRCSSNLNLNVDNDDDDLPDGDYLIDYGGSNDGTSAASSGEDDNGRGDEGDKASCGDCGCSQYSDPPYSDRGDSSSNYDPDYDYGYDSDVFDANVIEIIHGPPATPATDDCPTGLPGTDFLGGLLRDTDDADNMEGICLRGFGVRRGKLKPRCVVCGEEHADGFCEKKNKGLTGLRRDRPRPVCVICGSEHQDGHCVFKHLHATKRPRMRDTCTFGCIEKSGRRARHGMQGCPRKALYDCDMNEI